MISDDKMIHCIHLMLTGIQKGGLAEIPKEDEALRESRKTALLYLKSLSNVGDIARARILSQKNPPMEGTQQWDNLYQKYLEEEQNKKGG